MLGMDETRERDSERSMPQAIGESGLLGGTQQNALVPKRFLYRGQLT
jgi:hypothetical protein